MKSKSPTPKKKSVKPEMDFYEALRQIMMGKSVTKKEWKDRSSYGILRDGRLQIHLNGQYHDWILNDGDLHGDDFYAL